MTSRSRRFPWWAEQVSRARSRSSGRGRRETSGYALMRVQICVARGSVPSPGPEQLRYGGNTSCVHLTLADGTHLILDAGTGIRSLPLELGTSGSHIHVLLTHLHLDHIQGLL